MRRPAMGASSSEDLGAALQLREAGRYAEAERALEACVAARPQDLEAWAALAHVRLLQNQIGTAGEALAQALRVDAAAAPALRTAARLALAAGDVQAAIGHARKACAAPDVHPEDRLVLAMALARADLLDEAVALADEVLAEPPPRAEAHVVRMQALSRQGRMAEAVADGEAAMRLKPHLPLWGSIGALQLALGRHVEAAVVLRRAVELNPRDLQALVNLGEAERRSGRLVEAGEALGRATELDPASSVAWGNLGAVLQQQGRIEAARGAYDRALALDPGAAAVMVNLGRLLADLGRYGEAEQSCRRAIERRPDLAVGHYVLAGVLRATGRMAEAESAYGRALALQPGFDEAELGLAEALAEQLKTEEARARLESVLQRRPSLEVFLQARLTLSVVAPSKDAILAERARFAAGLEEALHWPGEVVDGARLVASDWFYLAYHGLDDRPLMSALDRMFTAKAPGLAFEARGLAAPAPLTGRRIRVGFVSQFLCNHTIGRVYRGLIAALDRSRFEIIIAHLPKTQADPQRAAIDALADRVIDLPPALVEQRRLLAETALDLLFFTDVGMAPASYLLARSRLAPVQAVGWGHPDTTGLKTLDYFVSFDGAEPAGAEAFYEERLVRLPRLACFYDPPARPARLDRQTLGLPAQGALYGCLQSLFKIHPDFDAVLAEIAARDPTGWIVFAEGPQPAWSQALRRRWETSAPGLGARTVFLPRAPIERYLATLAEMDILLDPPHFGSGTTFFDAMMWGAPVLTWPGGFSRGRIVAALYEQMGAGRELVVQRLDDYAARAVALAADKPQLSALRRELETAAERNLFRDARAVRAFEAFLLAAVDAAADGRQLASGWRPAASFAVG
ncbi:tetratricopeptide repeat protein [Phenylobacterium soli]|nr:tetratricopeptide repeat protein [Phenylobacterium soli]